MCLVKTVILAEYPVRRGFLGSITNASEYWIAPRSRTMTAESVARIRATGWFIWATLAHMKTCSHEKSPPTAAGFMMTGARGGGPAAAPNASLRILFNIPDS